MIEESDIFASRVMILDRAMLNGQFLPSGHLD